MRKIASQTPVLRLLLTILAACPAWSQVVVSSNTPAAVKIPAGATESLHVAAEPGSLQVIEALLQGGLVGLQSSESVRRVLDLGRGGHLLFAVQVPASGTADVEVSSAERLRTAEVSFRVVTGNYTPEQRLHLHAAGILFALADSTRRHQPHAPDATTALKDYDLAAAEAQAAGDLSLERWAMAQKGRFLLYQKSSFVATRDLLERAAVLPGEADPAVQALLYKTLSSCEYYLGNLAAAVSDGERALALYRETGDLYWQGVVLGNLIADYGELGRANDATVAAHEALGDAEQTQDTAGVVFCLTELANLYRQQGQLQPAFQAFRQAGVWAQDIRYAPLVQADIEQAQGQFYMDLGLWAEAQDQLRQCIQHAPGESPAALQARGLLARAMDRLGDVQGAVREYDAAIASARKLHLAPEEASLLLGRSAAFLSEHKAAALDDARTAARIADGLKSPALQIEAALAEGAACLQSCAEPAQAAQSYQQALEWIEQTGEREQEAMAYAGLARLHVWRGDDKAALEAIEHAVALLEHSRASFASHDLAASLFEERHAWYELATDITLRLDHSHPGQGFGEAAFRYAERARARAMLDALGDVHSDPLSSKSPELLGRTTANSYKIQAQKAELLTGPDPKSAAAKLQSLYREQDALDAEEQSSLAPTGEQRISSVADVQRGLLKSDAALISIAPGQHSSYRWVITRTSVRVDVLPSTKELDKSLAPLGQALLARRPSTVAGEDAAHYAARLAAFRAELNQNLEQAGALLLPALPGSIRHLYIVASGSLLALPWSALRTSCNGRPCYAVERYTISAEPSASVALTLAERSPAHGLGKVLLVSNPLRTQAQANLRWSTLGVLPGSRREAQAIAQVTARSDLHVLSGANATVENVSAALRDSVRVAHFAAHTVLVPHHPELSGIALSTTHSPADAGASVLWLHDIPGLHAPPLVVLSGCGTQGMNLAGEDLNTLTQAFFYAGAQQVVASTWAVDDDATVTLMTALYRNMLQRKMSAASALRAAQLHMMSAGADLADWAAFLVDGVPADPGPIGRDTR